MHYLPPIYTKTKDVLFGQTATTTGFGGLTTIKSNQDTYFEGEDDFVATNVNSNTTLTNLNVGTNITTLAGNITITLPVASTTIKQPITISNSNLAGFTCTIQRQGADQVRSPYANTLGTSFILKNGNSVVLDPDGNNWEVIGSHGISASSGLYESLVNKGGGQTITATSATKVEFNSVVSDPNGVWSTTNDRLTAPVDCFVQITGRIELTTANQNRQIQAYINGSFSRVLFDFARGEGSGSNVIYTRSFFNLIQLTSGQYLEIFSTSDAQPYVIGAGAP